MNLVEQSRLGRDCPVPLRASPHTFHRRLAASRPSWRAWPSSDYAVVCHLFRPRQVERVVSRRFTTRRSNSLADGDMELRYSRWRRIHHSDSQATYVRARAPL